MAPKALSWAVLSLVSPMGQDGTGHNSVPVPRILSQVVGHDRDFNSASSGQGYPMVQATGTELWPGTHIWDRTRKVKSVPGPSFLSHSDLRGWFAFGSWPNPVLSHALLVELGQPCEFTSGYVWVAWRVHVFHTSAMHIGHVGYA